MYKSLLEGVGIVGCRIYGGLGFLGVMGIIGFREWCGSLGSGRWWESRIGQYLRSGTVN